MQRERSAVAWQPLPRCGVEVRGLELAALSPADAAELHVQFGHHGLCVFRDIGASFGPEEHAALARRFGEINVNRFFPQVEGHTGIAKVEKAATQRTNIGGTFHADHTYDLAPALGSILVARKLPAAGGDTLFANMYAAYDSLPEAMKARLVGLRAVHSTRHAFGKKRPGAGGAEDLYENAELATIDNVHPVVIAHPLSGRKALFVNPGFTIHLEGQTLEESAPLLEALYHHAVRPEHIFRMAWAPGSAVMWDNRCMWHCAANDYHGAHRLMHRITVEGCELVAADPASPGSRAHAGEPHDVYDYPNPEDSPFIQITRSTMRWGYGEGEPARFPAAAGAQARI
jgi:taurine dioxygenase